MQELLDTLIRLQITKVSMASVVGIRANLHNMAIPVVEFSREGYKIRKVFGYKSTVVKCNF